MPSALAWPKAAGLAGLLAGLGCVWAGLPPAAAPWHLAQRQLEPLSSDGHLQALLRHADSLETKGDNTQAMPVWQEILAIREQQLGLDHLSTAISLNNLAELYRVQGRYGEAETLFHALLYLAMAKLPAAEPLLLRPDGTVRAIGLVEAAPIPTANYKRPTSYKRPEIGGGEPAGAGAVATGAGGLVSTTWLPRAGTERGARPPARQDPLQRSGDWRALPGW